MHTLRDGEPCKTVDLHLMWVAWTGDKSYTPSTTLPQTAETTSTYHPDRCIGVINVYPLMLPTPGTLQEGQAIMMFSQKAPEWELEAKQCLDCIFAYFQHWYSIIMPHRLNSSALWCPRKDSTDCCSPPSQHHFRVARIDSTQVIRIISDIQQHFL